MVEGIEQVFPHLQGAAWRVSSKPDDVYNCIAWAAGMAVARKDGPARALEEADRVLCEANRGFVLPVLARMQNRSSGREGADKTLNRLLRRKRTGKRSRTEVYARWA
jgi:hypothetical protein